MHCSYCGQPDHKRGGCYWFKHGLTTPGPDQANVASTEPTQPKAQHPVMPQDTSQQSTNMERRTYHDTLADSMAQQVFSSPNSYCHCQFCL
jgi:hypothetical protein